MSQNIVTFSDYRNLFEEQKANGIIDFKNYVKGIIFSLLENGEGNSETSLDNFKVRRLKTDTFSQIKNFLKEKSPFVDIMKNIKDNFSYQLLDSFIKLCKTPEEFKELLNDENILDILKNGDEFSFRQLLNLYDFKSLEQLKGFCNNKKNKSIIIYGKGFILEKIIGLCKNVKDFIILCKNDNIYDILRFGNEFNFKRIWNLYNIKTIKEFNNLCNNKGAKNIITFGKRLNVDKVIGLCKTIKEFEYLCNNETVISILKNSNEFNLKEIFSFYKINTLKKFERLCNNKKIIDILISGEKYILSKVIGLCKNPNDFRKVYNNENTRKVITYGDKFSLEKIWNLYNIKTVGEFNDLCNDDNVRYILINSQESNLEKIWNLYNIKTIKQFEKLCSNDNIKYILRYSIDSNLEKVIGLCENTNQFEELCSNDNIKYILRYSIGSNLEKVIGLCENTNQFEELCNNKDILDLLSYIIIPDLVIAPLLKYIKNNYSFSGLSEEEIDNIKSYLFSVKSTTNSRILNHLFSKMKDSNKGLYDIIQTDIDQFLDNNNTGLRPISSEQRKLNISPVLKFINKNNSYQDKKNIKELGINTNELELSIYLRYGGTVDFPEIGEYIVLFVNEYIKRGYSKYLSGIRLIPRVGKFPRKGLFKGSNIKKYNTSGGDFKLSLNEYAIPMHLGHSSYKDTKGLPHIISGSMESDSSNSIKLGLDLEEKCDEDNTKDQSLDDIFNNVLSALKEIDNRLDGVFGD